MAKTVAGLRESITKLEKPTKEVAAGTAAITKTAETPVVKSTLEEAAELLEKRQQDEDESDGQKVLAALHGAREQFEKFEADSNGRHEKLDERLNLAMGKG